MSIIFVSGDHPRHLHMAEQLAKTGLLSGWVKEVREAFVPTPPQDLPRDLKALFETHFQRRELAENAWFGTASAELDVNTHTTSVAALNSEETIKFCSETRPRLVISYGCHKLSENFIKQVGARFVNVHGGLSPEYRGVATHFWPSYFLEPQMTGMTLHETTNFLDAGSVIFQTASALVVGDSLHHLAARNVAEFSRELSNRLSTVELEDIPAGITQSGYGKVFMENDWRPEHLRLIYQHYEDRIVDAAINKEISGRTPDLICVL